MVRAHMLIVRQAAKPLLVEQILPRRPGRVWFFCIMVCIGFLMMCVKAYADDSPRGQVRKSCKEKAAQEQAANAFKAGIVAFERKDWVQAEYHMLTALEFGCSDEDLSVTVPYGRWRYKYQPSIYLGLTLHRIAQCLKDQGETCSIARVDWKGDWDDYLERRLGKLGSDWQKAKVVDRGLQSRCQQARAKFDDCRDACCVADGCFVHLRISRAPYYPAIDWRHKLDGASAGVTEDSCGEVTTPLEWFWIGKPAKDSNSRLCKELGQELLVLEKACPD
jgi:hypothetical protein